MSDPAFQEEMTLLEALVVDNPELEQIEALLDQFNIFEAIGAWRVELRHSDFLSFLLNPSQSHGLGDLFAKRLLQKALAGAPEQSPLRPIDLDLANLGGIQVLREWQGIDILLLDEANQLAVIIENKVLSGEHGDQLKRYREIIRQNHPTYRQVCLFLTPEGDDPSDSTYVPIDYTVIAEQVEKILGTRATTIGPDVRTLMSHYSQMLRRRIVSESEIAELCRKIYRKHQRALDLIYEYRPDLQAAVREILESLVQSQPTLTLDHCSKSYIRFAPKTWDTPVLLQGEGWTRSNRILLFEFGNFPERLRLSLIIGPGPIELRQKLMNMTQTSPILKPAFKSLGKSYNTIYVRDWISSKVYKESGPEEINAEILKKFAHFMDHDLPEIQDILNQQPWIGNQNNHPSE